MALMKAILTIETEKCGPIENNSGKRKTVKIVGF